MSAALIGKLAREILEVARDILIIVAVGRLMGWW